jgi:hypothetical protein
MRLTLTYSKEALEAAVFFPPLFFLLLLAVAGLLRAWWKERPVRPQLLRPYYWWALTQLVFFPAAIAVGVFMRASDCSESRLFQTASGLTV